MSKGFMFLFVAVALSVHQNFVSARTAKVIPFKVTGGSPPPYVTSTVDGGLPNLTVSLSPGELNKTLVLIKLASRLNPAGGGNSSANASATVTGGATSGNGTDARLPRIFNVFDSECGNGEMFHYGSGTCVPKPSDVSDYE